MWDEAREVGRQLGPVDPTPPGYLPEGERALARGWAIALAHGLVWIAFGVAVLVWPDLSFETLVALIATCALVHGAVSGVTASAVATRSRGRAWLVVDATAASVAGVVLLAWPDLDGTAALVVLAAWAIGFGALQVIEGHVLPFGGERAALLVWSGVVAIAFGVVMLIEADGGALAASSLIAAFAIVIGVLRSGLAIDLRRLARQPLS
jgi:uncharacterized membrane protein HdeD (DUF308 family)